VVWTVSTLIYIAVVLFLVLIEGCFVAAEIALVSLREGQVRALAAEGRRGAAVARLVSDPNRFLASVQIGVTLTALLSSAFGAVTLSGEAKRVLVAHGVSSGLASVIGVIGVTLVISFLTLVVGELAPKRLALQRAEGTARLVAPWLERLATLARPVIWALSKTTNGVVRALGGDPGTNREMITEDELRGLVAAHEELSPDERKLIDDVFAAGERQVSEVMIPRTEVEFLDGGTTVSRAVRKLAESPHSRYPVIGEGQDDVIGYVHIRDLTARSNGAGRATTVADIAREVKHLPGSKKVLAALSEMRREGYHVAIVVDEYGGTDGLVTLEDLIEEVIGEIHDEYDVAATARQVLATGEAEVDGLLNLDDFGEATGLTLPEGPYETAGGFVMSTLGRLPVVGDTVEVDGRTITVVALDGRRVSRLRVAPSADDAGGPREPAVKASAG
jgi:putative hemolysin